jgi:phage repressor protein C with HTH and peptisase S24 domain
MLCYDFDTNVCSVKYVSWAVKREYLAIESANRELYPPVYIAPTKVHIVGRVIWAWRKF